MQTPNLAHYSSYSESSLIPTANLMLNYILKPVKHESFFKKYAGKRFFKVCFSPILRSKYGQPVDKSPVKCLLTRMGPESMVGGYSGCISRRVTRFESGDQDHEGEGNSCRGDYRNMNLLAVKEETQLRRILYCLITTYSRLGLQQRTPSITSIHIHPSIHQYLLHRCLFSSPNCSNCDHFVSVRFLVPFYAVITHTLVLLASRYTIKMANSRILLLVRFVVYSVLCLLGPSCSFF